MSTLAIMKARIADELARSDLTSQISYAISDAIEAQNDTRFYFCDNRSLTFSTVAGQDFYSSSDAANIANILSIDEVTLQLSAGQTPYKVDYETPEGLELVTPGAYSTGQPTSYTFFEEKIRLYPVPSTSGWTVRVIGAIRPAAPASDGETGNPWMTKAAALIKARAKWELATHVLFDEEMKANMAEAVQEAERRLSKKTTLLTQHEKGRVRPMRF